MSKAQVKAAGKKHKKTSGKKSRKKALKQPDLRALPWTEMSQDVMDRPVIADSLGGVSRALETGRARWEQGDWTGLLSLEGPDLATDPERGKLALLLAAAHSHAGDVVRSKELASMARQWGASRTMTARVLLSAAQNSLARVAAALDEDPIPHFEAAVRLVQPHADAPLLARSRRVLELAHMGLLPAAASALEAELGLVQAEPGHADAAQLAQIVEQIGALRDAVDAHQRTGKHEPAAPLPTLTDKARIENVLGIYRNLPPPRLANFRYLDVKSLPRTGLHFMRNIFDSILQTNFSFCEWYTEPGCCGQMPCAVTGFATEGQDKPMLRMLKSHDFELSDPAFATAGPVRRLIMIRNPLYLLTSWWTLQTLYFNSELLKRHGIMTTKINFAHGPHVVRSAYRIIDAEAEMPSQEVLADWLLDKIPYMTGFVAKWQEAARQDASNTRIVRYQDTPDAALGILDEIADQLDDATCARLSVFRDQRKSIFVERTSPFEGKSTRISAFMHENSAMFVQTAQSILEQDLTGLLKTA